ncbi:hypothetical protein [Amycolatopsis sp. NPDC098790]|uniref:hypothetical protein n=1 Tax=Amycolatopsis sp. NPDC098790 TaxID=3363939 RepID=UPI003819BB7D
MLRRSWARDADVLFAASRRGVITVAQLAELGVPSRTSYRRCRPGQPWQRLLPGVILLRTGVPTRRQLLEGALLYCGDDAVVTGLESCRRQGLKRHAEPGEPVHLLVPAHRKAMSSGYVVVERTTRVPEPVWLEGLPLAPVVRSVLDRCRRLTERAPIRALLAEAVQQLRVAPAELSAELEAGSDRGSALPREALQEIERGARSPAEADAMALWRRTGLPEPVWNFDIHDEHGHYIATPDAWCDEVALAWEIDSYEFHFGQPGYAATLARNNRYAAAGVAVVQTLPSRLRQAPRAVAGELVSAYRAAAARPRPPVRLTGRRE